jgi:phosphoglycerate-specific signal transduction histidine kinase
MDWAYCPMTTTTAFTAFTSYTSTARALVVRDADAVADVVTIRRTLEELTTFLDVE